MKSQKIKCQFRQSGHNYPLDDKDTDPITFCEAYKHGDGYICNAAAMENIICDPICCKSCTHYYKCLEHNEVAFHDMNIQAQIDSHKYSQRK